MKFLYDLTNHTKYSASWAQVCDDASRRYVGTYMKLQTKEMSEPIVRYIRSINQETIQYLDEWERDRIQYPIHELILQEEVLPDVGYHHINTGGIYVQKNIRRQWKRSLCQELYYTNTWGSFKYKDFLQNTRNYQYTLNDIDIDSPKIALSPHLAVCYNTSHKSLVLLYDEEVVATIAYKQKKIVPLFPEIMQEIKDYLNKVNLGDTWKLMTPK